MSVKALFDLTGKTALITGGSRGLGLQMAEALGEMGARLPSRRKSDELAEAKAHLQGLGYQVETFTNDLQKFDTIPALVEDVLARCGDIDILVNNAGATWGAKAEIPGRGLEQGHEPQRLRALLPHPRSGQARDDPKGRGNVIITASVAAFKGTPPGMNTVAYNTSKAAAVHLARTLASEWGHYGIRVNSICPGFFPSKLANGLIDKLGDQLIARPAATHRRRGGPQGRRGLPGVRCIAHMTGQALVLDGGASLL
jgi:gluconate 5-dehydrogenase